MPGFAGCTDVVSIVMPAFNSMRYIDSAIQSVREQRYRKFELVVIDGGSTDGTLDIVRKHAAVDPRIRLILNKPDHGPAHARSVGIKSSVGEYVAFLDADDYWLPSKLGEQVAFMISTGARFSYTLYRTVSDNGERIGCIVPMRKKYNYSSALSHRGIGTLTVMVRRALLAEDVISVWKKAGGEEYLWWLLILKQGIVAQLLPLDLARYRNTVGSLSKNQLYTLCSVWKMYRRDLALPLFEATCHYISYVADSALRRIRMYVCSKLRK